MGFMMKAAIWAVLALALLGLPFLVFAEEKTKTSCVEQLKLVDALAREYDRQHDNAVREKVSYQVAYEQEKARRLALEKQLAELTAKAAPATPE